LRNTDFSIDDPVSETSNTTKFFHDPIDVAGGAAPPGWQHIGFTGGYLWAVAGMRPGGLDPSRRNKFATSKTAAASLVPHSEPERGYSTAL
jgi:hypothetical protein